VYEYYKLKSLIFIWPSHRHNFHGWTNGLSQKVSHTDIVFVISLLLKQGINTPEHSHFITKVLKLILKAIVVVVVIITTITIIISAIYSIWMTSSYFPELRPSYSRS